MAQAVMGWEMGNVAVKLMPLAVKPGSLIRGQLSSFMFFLAVGSRLDQVNQVLTRRQILSEATRCGTRAAAAVS